MRPFKFTRAANPISAIQGISNNPTAKFLAGGTNLIDLMKEDVAYPTELIDLNHLDMKQIILSSNHKDGNGISIGSLGKNTEVANHPQIRTHYPLLSKAILAGASAQIRNMATNGGNLLQRTRCSYFYDVAMPCNKRTPGSGCAAIDGFNRMHAIFGWSEQCVAVYPSDMAVALSALDASVKIMEASGSVKSVPIVDFHLLPREHPEKDNVLARTDLITAIEIPKNNFAAHSAYLKIRDRNSYAFALVSVAVGLELEGKIIKSARIALGGVAHKPWRAYESEKLLEGKIPSLENFENAAAAELIKAKPLSHNQFKIQMSKNAIVNALKLALTGTETSI